MFSLFSWTAYRQTTNTICSQWYVGDSGTVRMGFKGCGGIGTLVEYPPPPSSTVSGGSVRSFLENGLKWYLWTPQRLLTSTAIMRGVHYTGSVYSASELVRNCKMDNKNIYMKICKGMTGFSNQIP